MNLTLRHGMVCSDLVPLGVVVVHELESNKQSFFAKHTDNVSCLCVSRDGTIAASGMTFTAIYIYVHICIHAFTHAIKSITNNIHIYLCRSSWPKTLYSSVVY